MMANGGPRNPSARRGSAATNCGCSRWSRPPVGKRLASVLCLVIEQTAQAIVPPTRAIEAYPEPARSADAFPTLRIAVTHSATVCTLGSPVDPPRGRPCEPWCSGYSTRRSRLSRSTSPRRFLPAPPTATPRQSLACLVHHMHVMMVPGSIITHKVISLSCSSPASTGTVGTGGERPCGVLWISALRHAIHQRYSNPHRPAETRSNPRNQHLQAISVLTGLWLGNQSSSQTTTPAEETRVQAH